jgi:Pyruvate/2-oxoacid:ferredoxin oxidoreductase delta subunit
MILANYEDCKGCGTCVDACPVGAILLQNETISIDQDLCEGCQDCVDVCPQGALAYMAVKPEPESVMMIPEPATAEVISVQDRSGSESLRGLVLPALSSVLLWTGRELVPRLADFALGYLDRRLQTPELDLNNQNIQLRSQRSSGQRGKGRRRRQRQYRK